MAKEPKSDVAQARQALREALKSEPDRGPSAYAKVKELLPDIEAAKAKRFTDREILDLLKPHGVELSLGTFRLYVHRASKDAGHAPKRTRRPKAAGTSTPAPAPKAAAKPATQATAATAAPSAPKPPAGSKPSLGFESKFDDE